MAHDTKAYHKERNRILSEFNKAHGTKHKTLAAAGLSLAKPKAEAIASETNLPVEVVAQATEVETPKRKRTRKTTAKQAKAAPAKRTRKPKVAEPTADLVLEDGEHADSAEERGFMQRAAEVEASNDEEDKNDD